LKDEFKLQEQQVLKPPHTN